ncbi:hypothetical protein [Streptomyces sp. CAU 1734]|uniref:hypothetical protein n=1 Tax=Streptomyces sp. CAU 1734 TaxID=3140360 RepID=UPI003261476D
MNRNKRYVLLGSALAFLGLEVAAVHLFLELDMVALLCADVTLALIVIGCTWAALGYGGESAPDAAGNPERRRRRQRCAVADRDIRTRTCGHPSLRP